MNSPQDYHSLQTGFAKAKAITKKYAKTFYLASLFLPRDKREAAYAVYALCRISDEAVDDANNAGFPQERLTQLSRSIACAYGQGHIDDELLFVFRKTVQRYGIPQRYFQELVAGMQMDLDKKRYKDFDELSTYCYKVAGVVGLMMLRIFGAADAAADDYAIRLGIAMQLTNILRDIREDLARDRIYLPQEELSDFSLHEDDLASDTVTTDMKAFLKFQIARARSYYRQASCGIKFIKGIRTRLVVCVMKELYEGILSAIEDQGYNVAAHRAHVGSARKCRIIAVILAKGSYL